MSPTAPFLAPGRDSANRLGRPKLSGGATLYTLPGCGLGFTGTFTYTADRDYYMAFEVRSGLVIDQLAFEVTTLHASNMRVGIYRADTDCQPIGAPLADSGDISVNTTGVKTYTPGTPLYLPRGRYLTVHNQSGSPVMRKADIYASPFTGIASAMGTPLFGLWSVSRAYAAFPTPGTAWTTLTAQANTWTPLFMRVLTP